MDNKYVPLKPSFKKDFKKMCKELDYVPSTNKYKKEVDMNGIKQERTLYSGRGKGTL